MCVSCVLYRILAFCLRLRSKCKYEAPQIITVSFIVLTLDVLYIICHPIFFNSGWYEDFFIIIGLITLSYDQRVPKSRVSKSLYLNVFLSSFDGSENPSLMQEKILLKFLTVIFFSGLFPWGFELGHMVVQRATNSFKENERVFGKRFSY